MSHHRGLRGAGVVLAMLALSVHADTGSLTVLHAFAGQADGGNPQGSMVLGPDGALYGAAGSSPNSDGNIFRLTLDGSLTTLHGFVGTDGQTPQGLVKGPDGNLYGVTTSGGPGTSNYSGANSYGTIFRIGFDGTFTSLYAFNSGTVGTYPTPLIVGADGALYGTASESGTPDQFGAIYKMTLDGTVTPLYVFSGNGQGGFGNAGAYPNNLIQDADGSLFGTTGYGSFGSNGGSIFRYSPSQGLSTVHNFSDLDGTAIPDALVAASDGSVYGTTAGTVNNQTAGSTIDNGTVFRIASDGSLSYLYRFSGPDGSSPAYNTLVLGRDGKLYGTTSGGGANGNGVLYSINTDGTFFSVLHSFNGADGSAPVSPPLQLDSGALAGTTRAGGTGNQGLAYELFLSPQPAGVSLVASAATVAQGQSVTLNWSSSGATSCSASGQWAGSLAPTGSQAAVVSNLGANVFSIACIATDGSTVSSSATVTGVPAPSVSLTASATTAVVGQWLILNWSSTNATSCTASGTWSGSIGTSGTQALQLSGAGVDTFSLACGTAGITASASATVTVYAPRLKLSPLSASPYALTQQCVTAQLLDDATGAPIANVPVGFTINGVDTGGQTRNSDGSGMAAQCWIGAASGTDTLTATSGGASAVAVINWLKRPDTMHAQGFVNITTASLGNSGLLTFSAQLMDALNGRSLTNGMLVTFSVNNKVVCQSLTDFSGTASCQSLPGTLSVLGYMSYHASFAGNPLYLPSSADGTLLSVSK